MPEKIIPLGEGAQGLFIKSSKFSTTLISFNFYVPIYPDRIAEFALLPFMLTTCGKEYPDFSRLNFSLSKLYGAELSAAAEKVGDYLMLKCCVSVIDDRFALDGESICESAAQMLTSLIFNPKAENGAFDSQDLERERRKAIEHIRGEMSEKRLYARSRLIEEMYAGEPYGVPKCGTQQQVAAVTPESLYAAWRETVSKGFLRVNVISRNMPSGLFDNIRARLSELDRRDILSRLKSTGTAERPNVKEVCERMEVAQGKLCMGFSTGVCGSDLTTAPLMVMTDIFGGGPYSRLFNNVREKMSLCYYCSAGSVRVKGMLMVDSGVEAENAERAEKEILVQLDVIKNGGFTDGEFDSSVKSIIDSLKTYSDSQSALDSWYSVKIANEEVISPQEMTQIISEVTREQVIEAASGVKLNTVYKLLPKEGTVS